MECPEHAVERLFLLLGEKLHVLDAGELVMERVRHLYSLQIHGENRFLPIRGYSDLFGDIFGLERGLGGEKRQYSGVANGLDDLLASKGGALNMRERAGSGWKGRTRKDACFCDVICSPRPSSGLRPTSPPLGRRDGERARPLSLGWCVFRLAKLLAKGFFWGVATCFGRGFWYALGTGYF